MSDVFIKSGEQPRYFRFGSVNYTTTAAPTNSVPLFKESPYSSFQAIATATSGAVTGTILVQASNEEDTFNGVKSNWITIATITLSGTTTATDGFTTICPWRYIRASVTAISGTSAQIEVIMGV